MTLRPFIRYYGGKWRAAPLYPAPVYGTIIEPFAGAAGYAMRYPNRKVILVEKYPPLAEMWRWLIAARPAEVLAIPPVESVDDLPSWVPAGARALVGYCMVASTHHPSKNLSAGLRKRLGNGWAEGWGPEMRDRVASQVGAVKHWTIIEGDYTLAGARHRGVVVRRSALQQQGRVALPLLVEGDQLHRTR